MTELLVLVGILLVVFWLRVFYSLMSKPDSAFEGRNDKLIWAILLIVLNVFGAIVFLLWNFFQRDE